MHNSKLLKIIVTLNKSERKMLASFSISHYNNSSSKISILIPYLIEKIDQGIPPSDTLFDKNILWQVINPHEPFNYNYLRKIGSDAVRLIEDFFISEQVKSDIHLKTHLLLEATKRKKNNLLFDVALNRFEQNRTQYFTKLNSVNIYNVQILKNLLIIKALENKRYEDSGIDEIVFELDKFYITEKLKLLCELESRNSEIKFSQFLFFNGIIEEITNNEKFQIPSILVYFYIYKTISEPDVETNYYILRDLIINTHTQFDRHEAKGIFDATISFCTVQINRGNSSFSQELFDLYKSGLSKGIILIDNLLDQYHFKIIILNALRLAEYDWVEYFILEYKEMLPSDERENAVSYNQALLYFYKKDYNQVLKLLQKVDYEDFTYSLGSKSMLLATYYELDEFDPLHSLLDSFKVYLNRKKTKLPKDTITRYLNLIKFTRRLCTIQPGDKEALLKFETDLNKSDGVNSLQWLREKIEQLR